MRKTRIAKGQETLAARPAAKPDSNGPALPLDEDTPAAIVTRGTATSTIDNAARWA